MIICDIEYGFQEDICKVKIKEVGLISEGVEAGQDMRFRILLSRGSTPEVLIN